MDRLASGLLLMGLGVLLLVWYYKLDRMKREVLFKRITTGSI